MLEIKKISKIYKTVGFNQKALDEVSVNFRENEFAAILGPSGSGKTTLLNIIGGLDNYSSGDLVINEISTKKFDDKAWDTYRNHRIGFVFQSYNLIHHQPILANVELALTLSGISKKERKRRALKALSDVGLKDHQNKRPNQLSGGQMQRVAIARALVNDPDILLADEPTGALDSETSVQVMEILTKIADKKLVIMVTHNAEIAKKYSNRIIKLKDGKIIDDSNKYDGKINTTESKETTKRKSKKTSMSIITALSLSFNNLLTKKGRTFLTAFAGSIGIIGIALILSLSSGVNDYIERMEKETLSSYPIQIESNTIDYFSMMQKFEHPDKTSCPKNKICTRDDISINPYLQLESSKIKNNLKEFKKYLDSNGGDINDFTTDIQYKYNIDLHVYNQNTKEGIIKVNPNSLNLNPLDDLDKEYMNQTGVTINYPGQSQNAFVELIGDKKLLEGQYDILHGKLPENFNEVVLIVDKNNSVPISLMYSLDIENREEIKEVLNKNANFESKNYTYESLINKKYSLVFNTDFYTKEKGRWVDKSTNTNYMKTLINQGLELTIVGVVKVSDDAIEATSGYLGYTHDLIEHVINNINSKEITKKQLANPKINVFTGTKFDGFINSYEQNLKTLGIADLSEPSNINIYPNSFESKEKIEEIIKDYNKLQENNKKEENIITYTDYIGVLLSSVTTAVNVITYILIAFVAVSLIVSSIMIAIITYISVLERIKEIGILRAIGASKKDISRVFRAETMIEGLIAGFFGVGLTIILNIPINIIIHKALDVNNISKLPTTGGIALIIISVILTLIAGLIPAKIASSKHPVEALRSE
ncbi:MAG: ABC transporter ATP-binding protein/permease [Bacilli bacterium]|nr:ABC transporter ATP-binding protein/permease [Bacilli bacterium]